MDLALLQAKMHKAEGFSTLILRKNREHIHLQLKDMQEMVFGGSGRRAAKVVTLPMCMTREWSLRMVT